MFGVRILHFCTQKNSFKSTNHTIGFNVMEARFKKGQTLIHVLYNDVQMDQ